MAKELRPPAPDDTPRPAKRSEKEGLFHFGKEMISALGMALIFIIYIIQAFKIPTGSMEDSLLVGDFLLGLKFIYGAPLLPFSYAKAPAIADPVPGDVIIFEYPGVDNKDYIKRCVAGPGQTVEIRGRNLIVDGQTLRLPPDGKYMRGGRVGEGIADFAPLRIPAAGDTLIAAELDIRELVFAQNLMIQENPRPRLVRFLETLPLVGPPATAHAHKEHAQMGVTFLVDGNEIADPVVTVREEQLLPIRVSSHRDFEQKKGTILSRLRQLYAGSPDVSIANWVPVQGGIGVLAQYHGPVSRFPFPVVDNWKRMEKIVEQMRDHLTPDSAELQVRGRLFLRGEEIDAYVVRNDNWFMIGDNRDNSLDSRYWGHLNRNYIKAKAFILYFSLKSEVPVILLPLKIRWERIGRLIRGWDGLPTPPRG